MAARAFNTSSRQQRGHGRMDQPGSGLSLGIDIGGTFTDLVLHDADRGTSHTYKELTTPADPTDAVLTGLDRLLGREGLPIGAIGRIVHATTLFTNALIERKGAPTGLITTAGFRDVLEIGTERKFELYDLFIEMPRPLVPRRLRLEARERIGPRGEVRMPLAEADIIAAGDALVAAGVTSVAIVFLHAYANAAHEQQAGEVLLRHHPTLHVSLSSDVVPQIREYERTSTTVANAYVRPLADAYLERLRQRLRAAGATAELFLMLSNGGLTGTAEARRKPVEMLESGPAAGALAGALFGLRSGHADLLAFDMGGTTAKLSMIEGGTPGIAYAFEAAREKRFTPGSGLPISISTVELIEIGAGGGSIARLDALGLLKVGPDSAGSVPGPACYGRGGTRPTVTDANLALGYLDPDFFAGGTLAISAAAAEAALAPIAAAAALPVARIAWGIHDIVNENMASAARVHVAEHGRDPRRFALVTTGGGGPLHGCEVARKLGIGTVICPPGAGVASAFGMLAAPARVDRVATVQRRLSAIDWPALEARYATLEADATRVLGETGATPEAITIRRLADLRYAGQGFELVVPLPAGPYGDAAAAAILARFEAAYVEVFTRTPSGAVAEVVSIRVSATADAGSGDAALAAAVAPGGSLKRMRAVYWGAAAAHLPTPVHDRRRLPAGSEIAGPAVIEEAESTLLVPPGAMARIEASGNIVVILPAGAAP